MQRVCVDCGATFEGLTAKYCQPCRNIRASKNGALGGSRPQPGKYEDLGDGRRRSLLNGYTQVKVGGTWVAEHRAAAVPLRQVTR